MKSREEICNAPHFTYDDKHSGGDCIFGVLYFDKWAATCVIGMDEYGWEHVSVAPLKKSYRLSWDDMCRIKALFWNDDEEVYQIHPKKKEYVNIVDNCMHLWKPKGHDLGELVTNGNKKC